MKSKEIKKLKKVITILFIILFIMLVTFIILVNNPVDRRIKYIYNKNNEGKIDMMPLNVSQLFVAYNGGVNQRSIYKAMYLFADELVEKYHNKIKDFDEEQIKNYYMKKSSYIEKELGISNENDFVTFANELKKLNSDELILESYTINPDTVERKNGSVEFVLILKYQNNSKIGFYLNILNSSTKDKTPIKYRGGVPSELLEYEYEKPDFEDVQIQSPGKVIK